MGRIKQTNGMKVLRQGVRQVAVAVEVESSAEQIGDMVYATLPNEWVGEKVRCVLVGGVAEDSEGGEKPFVVKRQYRRRVQVAEADKPVKVEPTPMALPTVPVDIMSMKRTKIYRHVFGTTLLEYCRRLMADYPKLSNSKLRSMIKKKMLDAGFGRRYNMDATMRGSIVSTVRGLRHISNSTEARYIPSKLVMNGPTDVTRSVFWKNVLGESIGDWTKKRMGSAAKPDDVVMELCNVLKSKGLQPNPAAIGRYVYMRTDGWNTTTKVK